MIIEDIFVPIFSFLTPTYSEKRLRTETFGCKFRVFGPLGGVKNLNFEKSFNTPWDDYTRHICTNFELSNPYLFRKTAADGNFCMQISGFWTPRGVKKVDFGKSLNSLEMIIQDTFVPILSFLTPTNSEKQLWTDGLTDWHKMAIV